VAKTRQPDRDTYLARAEAAEKRLALAEVIINALAAEIQRLQR
jgi:hypothetical protein